MSDWLNARMLARSHRSPLNQGCAPYAEIKWSSTRHLIAPCDNYSPIPTTMKVREYLRARSAETVCLCVLHCRTGLGANMCRQTKSERTINPHSSQLTP